ncbi:MAG TPA: hypothetical protein VN903_28875 [Polyangia bacterium]|nr:hypothetical protein [Polyangia bacterium]
MCSFSTVVLAAGCALGLLACAGDGDVIGGSGGAAGSAHGGAGGRGASGGASAGGATAGAAGGGAGTTGTGGRGGTTGAAGAGGSSGGGAWDCLDVPGTLCICYMRAGTDAPACSPGFACCFQLNATSCECFVDQEDCTAAAAQYTAVATCPPP